MDLLTQGIDALIISPVKPDAMGPIVDAAKKKNIPVVVDDIGGGGTNYDAIVISDNAKGGLQAADYLDSLIKAKAGAAKKVASITCDPTAVYAWQRNVNFEKRIKELGYTVVASLNGNSKQEEGYRLMKDVLSANPDVPGSSPATIRWRSGRRRPSPTRASSPPRTSSWSASTPMRSRSRPSKKAP